MLNYERFRDFMIEYTDHFDSMVIQEQEKLNALLSYELKRIEHAIAAQQASSMQLANLEKKRIKMQADDGMSELSFREIIATVDGDRRFELQALFDRMQRSIDEVKRYNAEAMDFVKSNVAVVNAGITEKKGDTYSQNKTATAATEEEFPMFETKI